MNVCRRRAAIALTIAALTVLPYLQLRGHTFLEFDDDDYVSENLVVRDGFSWVGVRWAFEDFHVANWHPLTWLSHMADVEAFGLSPGSMLLVNASLHGANAALLFLVLAWMTGTIGASALVAVLFGIHPLHVESVAWISERKDVLSTFFGLIAMLAYARYVRRPSRIGLAWVTVAFAFSLLAKPMLVTLPFVLLLLDAWPLGRVRGMPWRAGDVSEASWSRLLWEKAPLLLLSLASSAITWAAQSSFHAVAGQRYGLGARVANALVSYASYLGKAAWPFSLSAFYPFPRGGHSSASILLASLMLTCISVAAILLRRRFPWVAVGWSWYLGTLVPVIGLLQVGSQAMADRYTYFPLIGIFIALSWTLAGWLARRGVWVQRLATVATLSVVAALTFATWRQVSFWKDHETLFLHAISVTGPNAAAHASLSGHYGRAGRHDDAVRAGTEAVRIDPGSALGLKNLGAALLNSRRFEEAVPILRRAVRADPDNPASWRNLGRSLRETGDLAGALGAFRRCTEVGPADPSAWMDLASVALKQRDLETATGAVIQLTRIAPDDPRNWFNLGYVMGAAGLWREAAEAYARALQLRPGYESAARNLAATCTGAGDLASTSTACAMTR